MSAHQLPKISIVTPSYNQGVFLGDAIESILEQNYPDVEHIIIDAGSTDQTLDVIRKYEANIAYWVSEPDRGQSHAINKGFEHATGDIYFWLCTDDLLEPGALMHVAEKFHDISSAQWLAGAARKSYRGREIGIRYTKDVNRNTFLRWASNWIPTQAIFWTPAMWEQAGPFDEDLHYVMDLALWERMYRINAPIVTDQILGVYRYHKDAKCIAHLDEAKKERRGYIERLLRNEWQSGSIGNPDQSIDRLLHEYAGVLEEASDYRAALDELTSHRIFGRLIKFWRRYVYSNFARV